MARVGVTCQGPRYGLSYIRKTHRLLSMLFRTFSHFFMLFIRKVEKAMSSTCQNAFRVAQKSRWPFKSKESIVAWKSTCILTKVKQKHIKYSTELVIVVAEHRVLHCLLSVVVVHRHASPSVLSGGCPLLWSSEVLGGGVHHRPSSLVVVFAVHHRPSSLSVIGDHRPSQSIAVAIVIHCHRRCHLSSIIVVHC